MSGAFKIAHRKFEILEFEMLGRIVRFRVDEELFDRLERCRGKLSGRLDEDVSRSAFYRLVFRRMIVVLERLIDEREILSEA